MAKEVEKQEPEFFQHAKAAGRAAVDQWRSLIPKEFWEHGRTARREALLAARSLVDAAIERLEETEGNNPRRGGSTRQKVKVEVE